MRRFFVCRAYFKWKGKMYHKGDLLPETFTHHDKARSIYNSRIGMCEVEDPVSANLEPQEPAPITTPLSGAVVIEAPMKVQKKKKVLKVEIPEVQDEVPEIGELNQIDEVSEKGTDFAETALLSKFLPGTSQ